MQVRSASLRHFRSYERLEIELGDGITVFHGAIGTGKTNLLEAICTGCLGRSFRTANDRELVRFGQQHCRVALGVADGTRHHVLEVVVEVGRGKVVRVDGSVTPRLADVEARPLVCVFAPDRLELVKGAAGVRRAHLDELVAALRPARRAERDAFMRALQQRNALVGRIGAGRSSRASIGVWNRELAEHGLALMEARRETVELLAADFTRHAEDLGLPAAAALEYRPRSAAASADELERELADALDTDMRRGFTTHGPHRDELAVKLGGKPLRRYGSQGQQRLGLLALLLAEWEVLRAERGAPPLLLLDDVMSELDPDRRGSLVRLTAGCGQTLVTTADRATIDDDAPVSMVAVSPSFGQPAVQAA